jgi:Mce-associated membrane protein
MEGDAGTSRLNPTDADAASDQSLTESPDPQSEESTTEGTLAAGDSADARRQSRLGQAAVATICAALLILAAASTVAGYLLFKANQQSKELARAETAALAAAKECVQATHAPDTAAMSAAQSKIIECSTGDFGAQASLYSGVLVDAYQAAQVKVAVSDMRAAVERHNDDGSFDVLVAVRVKVTNSESADQEQGYRLRLKMAPDSGTYKVAKLDQVTS